MKRLVIDVPASSANLGSGFDTLAMALAVLDTVTVELRDESDEVVIERFDGEVSDLDKHCNLLCQSYRRWQEHTGQQLPGARFTLQSRIPVGKGLGSSAAAIVAGLAAAAFAAGEKDASEQIINLATDLEGHADNVAAAALGGLIAAFRDGATVHALPVVNHLLLGIALFIPDEGLRTVAARDLLPPTIAREDAIFNLGRVAYLTTALMWGRWDRIGPAMCDRLHQPQRTGVIPFLPEVIASARAAGAYGAALSGGGPSVIALGPLAEVQGFAAAMEDRARSCGWPGKSLVTEMRHLGVQVREEEQA